MVTLQGQVILTKRNFSGDFSERKEFAPLEEQILSLKSSSHVEGLCPSEKQPGNFRFCLSLCSNGEKTWCTYALTTQYHCMEKMNGIITMI